MKTLQFSTNWNNKLNNKAFTTLRLSNRFEIGDKVEIFLKGNEMGIGEIADIRKIGLQDINEWIARLDTGYSREECQKILLRMYKNKNIDWDTQIIYLILIVKIQ